MAKSKLHLTTKVKYVNLTYVKKYRKEIEDERTYT